MYNLDEPEKNVSKNGLIQLLVDLVKSMRPKQWYKNLLLFTGIIFSMNFFSQELWALTILGFSVYSLLSGGIYLINDILDAQEDRLHPVKQKRPIASGRLNGNVALFFALLLIFISIFISTAISLQFLLISVTYLGLTMMYNLMLKKLYLIDVFTISFGFVLRAIAGCVLIGVIVSQWLFLCTFLMAIFLVFSKRRHELILLDADAVRHRFALKNYSINTLDSLLNISASMLIVSYSLYTFFSGHEYQMLTIPLVMYGIFRYLGNVYNKSMGGEAELIFKDPAMIIDMLLWLIVTVSVLLNIPEALFNMDIGLAWKIL